MKSVSFGLLARGRVLADALDTKLASVVIGSGVGEDELQSLVEYGADEVCSVQDAALTEFGCGNYSRVLVSIVET